MNRDTQCFFYFSQRLSIEHDCFVALQHLSRYQNKLAVDLIASSYQVSSCNKTCDRNVSTKIIVRHSSYIQACAVCFIQALNSGCQNRGEERSRKNRSGFFV